ncbi:MAG: TSUP family transporter [Rhodocyclaceae bacterium]|nr:TSUP family transporter [Rhodocyclaceae bacterium]
MSIELLLASFASLCAGMIDAIVGGGGLVLVPALFATFPAAPPASLLGTNKCASVWGTLMASRQYARRVQINWRVLLPAAGFALAGGLLGAWAVTQMDPAFLRRMLPIVLVAVFAYTLWNKGLGTVHAPRFSAGAELAMACAIGAVIGFYDGFFGPGTGSFFIFLLVRLLGYDFLHASASAKILNVATNLSALALFAAKGHVWWQVGLTMAVANIAGSVIGTRLALKYGAGFVRRAFIGVVGALILKSAYDALIR